MASPAARFVVSTPGLSAELGRFHAVNAEIDRVATRAVAQVTRAAGKAIKRGLATATGVNISALTKKKRVTARAQRAAGLVWIGLEPLLPTHLGGQVRQTATGVTAGNQSFVGAFHAAIFGSEKKVWIRLHSKHYDADLYPYRARRAGVIDADLRHRFPVVLGRVKVDTAAVRDMIADEERTARDQLADLVAQELGLSL